MDMDDDNSSMFGFPHEFRNIDEGLPIAEEMVDVDGSWTLSDSFGAQNPFLTAHQPQAQPQLSSSPSGLPVPSRKSSASGAQRKSSTGSGAPVVHEKLERSRQSARECRARKKLRYQYLEEMVTSREKAIYALRQELDMFRNFAKEIDEGRIPEDIVELIQKRIKAEDPVKGICTLQLGAD